MLTFLLTCWDMKFYNFFLWVSFVFLFFFPSPALKVGPNMVTVNHSDWVNTCHYRFRCLTVPLLISETERELARPSLESLLGTLKLWAPCNVISIFLTFQISGSKETIALLVFVEQPQWCFSTLLNFSSICSFPKKASACPSPFTECQVL